MATDTKLNELVINVLDKAQYDELTKDDNQIYLVSDDDTTTDTKLYRNNIVISGTLEDNTFWLYLTIYQKTDKQITTLQELQDVLINSAGSILQTATGYIKINGSAHMIYILTTNLTIRAINSTGDIYYGSITNANCQINSIVVEVL